MPEGKLLIELLITPIDPYQKKTYTFEMLSKSGEQADAPLIKEQGRANITGISWFGRYVPVVLVILINLGLIGAVAWFTFWRLNQMDILTLLALG